MSYEILYDGKPRVESKEYVVHKRVHRFYYLMIFCILLTVLMFQAWPEGKQFLRSVLIPGNADITAAAFESSVAQLQEGKTIKDVAEFFCREIFAGAALGR